jgi:hypothetical protein
MLARRRGRGRQEEGQALLELALVTPILVLLFMAIFQFAYVIQTQMGLTNALREAGRRVAASTTTVPVWADLENYTLDQLCGVHVAPCSGGLLADNVSGFDPARVGGGLPDVQFCRYDAGTGGVDYQVIASVTYNHPLFFGLMAFATDALDGTQDGNWTLTATAQMRLENIDGADPTLQDPGPCP